MEEDKFYKEILEPLDRFEKLEKETKKIVEENKRLKEKNKQISDLWMKYFRKSVELNSEIFMDFKQELNRVLEIENRKILNQEILDREDREFKKIEQAIKKIEELETGLNQ